MLTQAQLRARLRYDPETGYFFALHSVKQVPAGARAGSLSNKGYWRIKIGNREYSAHRLAWLYVHGEFPSGALDHINRVRDDNRIVNLRPASFVENGQNRGLARNNTSGYTGVTYNRTCRKWQASICVRGKHHHLGLHTSAELAAAAYAEAKKSFHSFHPTTS